MTDLRKAAEMALEVLTLINQDIEKHRATLPIRRQPELCKASLALRQALAQPEQGNSSLNYHIAESNTPLDKIVELAIQGHANTRDAIRWAMQQEREWVGLTDEEVGAWPVWSPEIDAFVRNIEAKLKEKNCG